MYIPKDLTREIKKYLPHVLVWVKGKSDSVGYTEKQFNSLDSDEYKKISKIILLKNIHMIGTGEIRFKNLKEFISNGKIMSWEGSLKKMFEYSKYNPDISTWDVLNVEDMYGVFCYAILFNSDLSNWNVSNVEDMRKMFYGSLVFNSDLSTWDVSNVEDMSEMFYAAKRFNSDISNWDVSNVEDMKYILWGAKSFNSAFNPEFI